VVVVAEVVMEEVQRCSGGGGGDGLVVTPKDVYISNNTNAFLRGLIVKKLYILQDIQQTICPNGMIQKI